MKSVSWPTFILGLVLGGLAVYLAMPKGKVTVEEFQALKASHARAVAANAAHRAERDAWKDTSAQASQAGDSIRGLRETARRTVLESPDSAAKSLGLNSSKPDSGTRCLPLSEFADLVASKIELELADSAALRDSVALNACENALAYSDSAEVIARVDGEASFKAAEGLAREVQTLRRARWWYGAGGAALTLLVILGAGAL